MHINQEPAFVLHHYSYGETSLLLEIFTRQHGRLGVVAKGARRARSPLRSALIPFQLLVINYSGRGELPTLVAAEPVTVASAFTGEALYCGLYLNELLLRLLHRHDPHENLFQSYAETLTHLGRTGSREAVLRVFEKRLLEDIGYGLVLTRDGIDGSPVHPDREYCYAPERGPLPAHLGCEDGIRIAGRSLLSLASEELGDPDTLRDAKRLLRGLLARQLGNRPLMSRQLFHPERTTGTVE